MIIYFFYQIFMPIYFKLPQRLPVSFENINKSQLRIRKRQNIKCQDRIQSGQIFNKKVFISFNTAIKFCDNNGMPVRARSDSRYVNLR